MFVGWRRRTREKMHPRMQLLGNREYPTVLRTKMRMQSKESERSRHAGHVRHRYARKRLTIKGETANFFHGTTEDAHCIARYNMANPQYGNKNTSRNIFFGRFHFPAEVAHIIVAKICIMVWTVAWPNPAKTPWQIPCTGREVKTSGRSKCVALPYQPNERQH